MTPVSLWSSSDLDCDLYTKNSHFGLCCHQGHLCFTNTSCFFFQSQSFSDYIPEKPVIQKSDSSVVSLRLQGGPDQQDEDYFIIQYKKQGEKRWQTHRDTFPVSCPNVSVQGLQPETTYTLRVKLVREETGDETKYGQCSDFVTTLMVIFEQMMFVSLLLQEFS